MLENKNITGDDGDDKDDGWVEITQIAEEYLDRAKTHLNRLNIVGRRLSVWANDEIVALRNSQRLYAENGKPEIAEFIEKRITEILYICEEFNEAGMDIASDVVDIFVMMGAELDEKDDTLDD